MQAAFISTCNLSQVRTSVDAHVVEAHSCAEHTGREKIGDDCSSKWCAPRFAKALQHTGEGHSPKGLCKPSYRCGNAPDDEREGQEQFTVPCLFVHTRRQLPSAATSPSSTDLGPAVVRNDHAHYCIHNSEKRTRNEAVVRALVIDKRNLHHGKAENTNNNRPCEASPCAVHSTLARTHIGQVGSSNTRM